MILKNRADWLWGSLATPAVLKKVINQGTVCSVSVAPVFSHAAVKKAASRVALPLSAPTERKELLGSVEVVGSAKEGDTGFVSLRKENIHLKAKDLKTAGFHEQRVLAGKLSGNRSCGRKELQKELMFG